MEFHFLHAADIHLDSPLRGLGDYEGAPVEQFRNATREAFRNLVNHAIDTRAAFVVIAGDLYDGDWPDFSTGLFLVKELERLNQANIRVAILFGNHDAENRITKSLPWPSNAQRFDHKKPSTIEYEDLAVALHGQSFSRMDVTENLVDNYPAPSRDRLNIGVLHTALEGNARHPSYAPCSLSQLVNRGYAYWALGHVHGYDILNRDPWVVFPGNLQGRHIRETGAKGCVSVSVRDGQIVNVERVILDVVRWIDIEVDVTGLGELQAIKTKCGEAIRKAVAEDADSKPAAVRVRVSGQTAAHGDLMAGREQFEAELQATMLGLRDCWLESLKIQTAPLTEPSLAGADEASNLLGALLTNADSNGDLKHSLEESLRPLLEKLPAELGTGSTADGIEESPLLTALRAKDISTLIREVLPDLSGLHGTE